MNELKDRISRFQNMASADPENALAHYSLGSAYHESENYEKACESLLKSIELDREISRSWQLLGDSMIKSGKHEEAIKILTEGYTIATKHGDLMPKNAIGELLDSINQPRPDTSAEEKILEKLRESGNFICSRSRRPGTKMSKAPLRGDLGKWLIENISDESWQEWIGQGTKVINELRLDFSREEDQKTYDHHMIEWLGIPEDLLKENSS
tara:strand:+ start:118 stop:747 length:630 start_codon:yes stop_codon:yes gene_type:complete